uniref:integrase core domain-containing protein n=1 Tax=Burkholderia cenocepacia TaxID=95486 RepID=UPI001FC8E6B0
TWRVHRSSTGYLIHPFCNSTHATPPRLKVLRRPVECAQYVSIRYSERLAEAGIEPSVGSRGDSYDNALAETINGLYKTELIRRRAPWKTRESVELATLEWVAWYNHHRLMEPLGYIPPAEAEANYYRQLRNAADVSALT